MATPLFDTAAYGSADPFAFAVANNPRRAIYLVVGGTTEPTAVQRNGQSFSMIAGRHSSGSSFWRLLNPTVGTFDITITGGGTFYYAIAMSLYDVDQTTPEADVPAFLNADGASPWSLDVASLVDALVIDLGFIQGTGVTVGAGQTQRLNTNAFADYYAVASTEVATGTSTAMQWSAGTPGEHFQRAVAVRGDDGSAAATPFYLSTLTVENDTSFDVTVLAGSRRYAILSIACETEPTSMVRDGQNWVKIASQGGELYSMWRCIAPTVGTHALVISGSGTVYGLILSLFEDVNQTTPERGAVQQFPNPAAGSWSRAITTAVGDLALDHSIWQATAGLEVGGGPFVASERVNAELALTSGYRFASSTQVATDGSTDLAWVDTGGSVNIGWTNAVALVGDDGSGGGGGGGVPFRPWMR